MMTLRFPGLQWRTPKLWVRLLLGFGVLLGLMGAVVVIAVLQFRSLAAQGEQFMRQDLHRLLAVHEIVQHAQGHGGAMARLLTAPRSEREAAYPRIDAEYAEIDRLLGELVQKISEPESRALLDEVVRRRSAYREVFGEIVVWIESEAPQHAQTMFNDAGEPALAGLFLATKALLDHEVAALEVRQQASQAQIRQSEYLLAALAAVALALSVLLAWRTTVGVARPLNRIEAAAHRIASGDYTTRVRVRGGDELGKVALAMNAMAGAVATREAEIESLAYIDRLSGLPNRTMLRRLALDLRPGGMAIIMLDLARLRTVNEVLGFDTGDALLVQIAERLRLTTAAPVPGGPGPVLARLAGGVFVVVCVERDRAAVEQLRGQIDDAMTAPLYCAGQPVDVNFVYGLADASGGGAEITLEDLLRRADLALGEAKRARRSWAWHVPEDDGARARQLSLLSNLRNAAIGGELEMWLQPKQCLQTGRTFGLEALVRWRHPQWGYVSPAEFIPFAERTGHIGVVTETMIDAALRALAQWRHTHPELSIAVNVSALDIQDPAFVESVQRAARRQGMTLDRLRLEITESSLMEDADRALPVLQALRALGVQLSIDDFGTGYSSLAYLRRLPVNELKIDRAFVAGADATGEARALLRTIIDLGHSLNMCVTAEGVERVEEMDLLRELGCNLVQGFLISRPLDPQAAARYVAALPRVAPGPVPAGHHRLLLA